MKILIFWVISTAENSNKIPKNQVLEGKTSWGRGNTWANGTGHTNILESFYILGHLLQLIIKIWQIWAIFLPWKSFVLVEIIFFRTKLGENLPVNGNGESIILSQLAKNCRCRCQIAIVVRGQRLVAFFQICPSDHAPAILRLGQKWWPP